MGAFSFWVGENINMMSLLRLIEDIVPYTGWRCAYSVIGLSRLYDPNRVEYSCVHPRSRFEFILTDWKYKTAKEEPEA